MITVIIANIIRNGAITANSDSMVMFCIVIVGLRYIIITIKMIILLEFWKSVIENYGNFVLLEIWASAFGKWGKSFLLQCKVTLALEFCNFY